MEKNDKSLLQSIVNGTKSREDIELGIGQLTLNRIFNDYTSFKVRAKKLNISAFTDLSETEKNEFLYGNKNFKTILDIRELNFEQLSQKDKFNFLFQNGNNADLKSRLSNAFISTFDDFSRSEKYYELALSYSGIDLFTDKLLDVLEKREKLLKQYPTLTGDDFKKEFAGNAVAVEEKLIPDSELPVAQSLNYYPDYFNIAEAKVVPTARIYAQNFLNSGQIESDIITIIG